MDGKRVFVLAMLIPELCHGRYSRYRRRHSSISDRSIARLQAQHRQAAIKHPITPMQASTFASSSAAG